MQEDYVPSNDIYAQEFFLHCYSLMTKERRNFQESKEGFTYMMQKNEERITSKLLPFQQPSDTTKWNSSVKRIIKSLKKNESDDFDTDYVDVDALLNLYVEYFKQLKQKQQTRLKKHFMRLVINADTNNEISVDNMQSIMS